MYTWMVTDLYATERVFKRGVWTSNNIEAYSNIKCFCVADAMENLRAK